MLSHLKWHRNLCCAICNVLDSGLIVLQDEDGGSRFSRKFGNNPQNYAVPHHKKSKSKSPPRENLKPILAVFVCFLIE
jgi:hypothetical protein